MSFIADSSIACVVTSPPYPMIEMWDRLFRARNPETAKALEAGDGLKAFALMHADLDLAWREAHRVLIPGGWACINIGDATRTLDGRFRLYPNHARVISACASLGFDILPAVLWRKQTNAPNKFMGSGMLPAGAYVTLEHEYNLLMRKGAKREFGSEEEREARRESAIFWEERNRWYSDVWDFKGARQDLSNGGTRERSASFPFELPYRLINMYSVRGDTVLDPFVGTGRTILAAMASGRNSIGVDMDEGVLGQAAAQARDSAAFLNRVLRARADGHAAFVEEYSREKGPLGHVNKPHGFPVMTSQEEDLRLEYIDAVRAGEGGSLTVSYRS
jgi:DNA modification methylase